MLLNFFRKVKPLGSREEFCWLWTGAKDNKGYGLFRKAPKKIIRAHRFSFEMFCGAIKRGHLVCHKCDNPSCVNPIHLFEGTYQDNIDDCIAKNRRRYVSGELHGNSKLTNAEAEKIRILSTNGLSQRQLAEQFKVSYVLVNNIVRGKTYSQVSQ